MKSVKKVLKEKLLPYNLRSKKSAVLVVKASTPTVNREVQASLSEEENCTLLCGLPYYDLLPKFHPRVDARISFKRRNPAQ